MQGEGVMDSEEAGIQVMAALNNQELQLRNLPPGYRFYPTPYEALIHYLIPKVYYGRNMLPGIIHDVDLYNYDPSDLPGLKTGEKAFYFTPRDTKHANGKGKRSNRRTKTGKGYWRMTSKFTPILDEENDESTLGKKNTLVYFLIGSQDGQKDVKTNYIMHEYELTKYPTDPANGNKMNNFALCRIHLNESAEELKKKVQAVQQNNLVPVGGNGAVGQQIFSQDKRPLVYSQGEAEQSMKKFRTYPWIQQNNLIGSSGADVQQIFSQGKRPLIYSQGEAEQSIKKFRAYPWFQQNNPIGGSGADIRQIFSQGKRLLVYTQREVEQNIKKFRTYP